MENHASSFKALDIAANIATILVSLLLSLVLVRQFLLPPPSPASRQSRTPPSAVTPAARGSDLRKSLPGVNWEKNGRTLVLAISTQCHFCTDSAPFFKRLRKEVPAGTKLLAVLPQPAAEGRQYLTNLGVEVDDIEQTTLNAIGVRGTPTLLLVASSGKVSDVWEGRLEPNQQDQVLATLRNYKPSNK